MDRFSERHCRPSCLLRYKLSICLHLIDTSRRHVDGIDIFGNRLRKGQEGWTCTSIPIVPSMLESYVGAQDRRR